MGERPGAHGGIVADLPDRLTPEQDAILSDTQERWRRAGLNCEPADRPAAEAGVRLAYQLAGLDPPARIAWLDSPIQGAIAAAALSRPDLQGPAARLRDHAGGGDPARSGGDAARSSGWLEPRLPGIGIDDGRRAAHPGRVSWCDWCDRTAEALEAQGLPIAAGSAGAAVRERLRGAAWSAARADVRGQVGPSLWAQAWAHADPLWTQLVDLLVGRLRVGITREIEQQLGSDRAAQLPPVLLGAVLGQHEAGWLAAFDGLGRAVPGLRGPERLAGLMAVAQAAGWWWPFERVALLTERPVLLRRDSQHRLHHPDGPAAAYPDGFAVHAWHGMPVTPELTATLANLTVERIQAEVNAELRRVMIEHYGEERYLRDVGGRLLDSDDSGTLWHLPVPGDEPLVMVEVVNATPEPDGTRRRYWLRVPPSIRSARAAVAWTFGLEPEEYQPLRQT
jgi:hypothetical protein